ncbi:hypothetical protein AX15_001804 [Amanita polypyramis BW_CC]|nr:hypothetical protein AX15_001804 [Amanita polypyramis BW_CC]
MFARATFLSCLVLLLVGQALSLPLPSQPSNIVVRSAEPLDTIVVYERALIPAEVAVRSSDDGQVVPFSEREEELLAKRSVPVQTAAKAPDGNVVPFGR